MNTIRSLVALSVAATVVLAAGCATPYVPAQGEALVPMRFIGIGQPQLCKDGQIYGLTAVGNTDTFNVPAGRRIAIGSHMHFSGYNVSYRCSPWIGVTPEVGRAYVVNSGLSNQRCFVELVREDSSKDTGVAFEPSVGAPACMVSQPKQ